MTFGLGALHDARKKLSFPFIAIYCIYIIVSTFMEGLMPQKAKVFQSGNSQAVRLPKEFRFNVDEVEVTREGDAIILRPYPEVIAGWSSLRAALARGVSDDFLEAGREQMAMQDRPSLDKAFN